MWYEYLLGGLAGAWLLILLREAIFLLEKEPKETSGTDYMSKRYPRI